MAAAVRWWPTRLKREIARALFQDNELPRTYGLELMGDIARAILRDEKLSRIYGLELLARIAPHVGVNGLRASGGYGDIISAPHDLTIFRMYAETGEWARHTNALFQNFFDQRRFGTYLDIGANIGLTTLPIASAFPDVRCFAFEPEPENFRNLEANISLSRLQNVTALQTALFDREAMLQFEIAIGNLGDHRLRVGAPKDGRLGEERRKVIKVAARPLDVALPEVVTPLAVKIDTQGAEPYVVAGGRQILAQAELLVMEWSPYHMAQLGSDPHLIIDFLRETFVWGQISKPEGEFPEALLPITEICQQLEAFNRDNSTDPHNYADLVVTKAAA
jgi:FkbM family methyltransferase